jgi:hypothetical protein
LVVASCLRLLLYGTVGCRFGYVLSLLFGWLFLRLPLYTSFRTVGCCFLRLLLYGTVGCCILWLLLYGTVGCFFPFWLFAALPVRTALYG